MAKSIKPTPALYGKDAERFRKNIENPKAIDKEEIQRIKKLAETINSLRWKNIINTESETGEWDWFHDPETKEIKIVRFKDDIPTGEELHMTYSQWEDLAKLINRITKP